MTRLTSTTSRFKTMGNPEFGISDNEQLSIRAHAVHDSLDDLLGPISPEEEERAVAEHSASNAEKVAQIIRDRGVSAEEARLILTEQMILDYRKAIEKYG